MQPPTENRGHQARAPRRARSVHRALASACFGFAALLGCRTIDEGVTRISVSTAGEKKSVRVGMERGTVEELLAGRLKWAGPNRATVTNFYGRRRMFDSRKVSLYFRDDVLIAIIERGKH